MTIYRPSGSIELTEDEVSLCVEEYQRIEMDRYIRFTLADIMEEHDQDIDAMTAIASLFVCEYEMPALKCKLLVAAESAHSALIEDYERVIRETVLRKENA